jgi:hypothetical protein
MSVPILLKTGLRRTKMLAKFRQHKLHFKKCQDMYQIRPQMVVFSGMKMEAACSSEMFANI